MGLQVTSTCLGVLNKGNPNENVNDMIIVLIPKEKDSVGVQ